MRVRSFADVTAAIGRRWVRLTAPKIKYDADLPVFIVTRDRVAALSRLVTWLENEGMTNLVILDNDSTYPPLLEYLDSTPHTVFRLGRNIGHTAPWDAAWLTRSLKVSPSSSLTPTSSPTSTRTGP